MRSRVLILLVLSANFSFSQQDPILSSEGFMPIWNNPASFGTWNTLSFNSAGRIQWPELDGHPKNLLINVEGKVAFGSAPQRDPSFRLSMGVNYLMNSLGGYTYNRINFPLNKIFNLKDLKVAVALSPGIQRINLDQQWYISPQTPIDPNLPHGTQTKFDMDAGVMVYGKRFYIGLSTTHLLEPVYDEINITTSRYYYSSAGYKYTLKNGHSIFPQLAIKHDGLNMVFNSMIYYQLKDEIISFGLGFRQGNTILTGISSNFKKFKLAYNLDIYNSSFNFNGSPFAHEIRLSFVVPDKH